MKEKKSIDKIFNKGFKNLEATPSPRVWENIQAQLKKEQEDRKVIPLWIKVGGIAALLAILFSVGNVFYNPSQVGTPSITDGNTIKFEKEQNGNPISEKDKKAEETQVASEENTLHKELNADLNTSKDNFSKENNKNAPSEGDKIKSSQKIRKSVLVSNNSIKTKSERKQNLQEENLNQFNKKEAVAGNNSEKVNDEKINSGKGVKPLDKNYINKEKISADKDVEAIVYGNSEKSVKTDKKMAGAEIAKNGKIKKSIFDAIAEDKEETAEKIDKKDKPEYRWNIAPNVAPVYYSGLGNGSSIDPSFADNPQKGDVNMSYGVQVSYALNNRLSVRTGVNNVDLSYSTSGVDVATGPAVYALGSVDYQGKNIVTTVVDKGALEYAGPSNGFGDVTPKSTQGDARLIQNLNYYEVPVELKYAVFNSKLGVNIIGGLSTMFLGNNEISVKADNFDTVLGDANNLSSVSFSTNIGLGLDYKLSKKFTFNIEPMFKYQLNPYTDSSVNFKPYYLGVYSGLSFKF